MHMQRTCIPLTFSHIPHAAMLLARAFQDDPFYTCVLPDSVKRAHVLPWLQERLLRYGLHYGTVYTTPSVEGVAIWLGPEYSAVGVLGALQTGLFLLPLQLSGPEFQRSLRLSNYADRMHKSAVTGRHLYLMQLGVEPALQGQGIGSALLQMFNALADRQALICYLETNNEKNLPLYERNGFAVVSHGQAIPGGAHTWAMLRKSVSYNARARALPGLGLLLVHLVPSARGRLT